MERCWRSLRSMGKDDKRAVADLIGGWNTRDVRIVMNIVRIAGRPGDQAPLIMAPTTLS